MVEKLDIFIGYDRAETVAYHVAVQSLIEYCSIPFTVTPLVRNSLPVGERDAKASTDFADTRFLVPYLCDYKGWGLFIDCDEMFTTDPNELWDLRDDKYSVMCRKHVHRPEEERKFLNQPQYKYQYKNWSSCMLFNNEKCKVLTPAFLNATPGLDLHQFKWLSSMDEIGEIPEGWNHLVDVDYAENYPKLLHWTKGTPCFREYHYAPYSREWKEMLQKVTSMRS